MASVSSYVNMKVRGHLVVTLVALLGCGWFVVCGTYGGQVADDAGIAAAGIAGFVVLAHVLLTLCHPIILRPGHGLALMLALGSPFAFLLPVFARPDAGWPVNPVWGPRANGRVHSRVVAPGDLVSMSWNGDGLQSVRGLWRGTPQVSVLNANELGCAASLPATGKSDNWDSVIRSDPRVKAMRPFLTTEFRMPADESLVGKSLKLQVTLPVEYPTPQGQSNFVDANTIVTRFHDVLLVSSEEKQSYWDWWSRGATSGLTSTVLAGLLLTVCTMKSQASPVSRQPAGSGSPWRVQSETSLT